ncbi:ferric reductase transmembrane component [Macrophomina phaseolina]|uniref:Ferric reductase transmembrane component n=1 Tax=Macrophomina phaseolina TaxID=35725 RepID=A0ABQ8G696_9PEZI|nr:ferric reductase transmembrane component [Macrophomina phaseolina]
MEDPSSAWLRAAIHQAYSVAAQSSAFSFSAASPLLNDDDTISVNEDFDPDLGNNPGKDPRFRKLVEAVLFSRAFMNTYNIVLLVVLLGFTIAQWGGVMQRAYRRRAAARRARNESGSTSGARTAQGRKTVAAGAEESGASSSSSSTLEGTATPPDVPKANANRTPDERQPLLPRNGSKVRKTGGLAFVLHRIKAWLMYQPLPIPVINKELPSNGQTLVILAFLGLNIFYLFFRIEFTPEHIFVFADRCGILIAINLPLLYLFAAKNQPITWLTGYSYESLNIFHRRLGELLCLSAFLHGLGMFAVWYGLLRKLGFTLARFVFSRVVLFGLLAFVCYELLYITSLRTLRVRCYELFLTLHVVLQAFALVFLFIHHSRSRIWVGIALLIFVIDRFIYRLGIKSTYLRADLSILPDGQTVRLSSNWSIPPGTWTTQLTRRTVLRGWNAPDHVFISIPALGGPHALQAHPFTVATPAPSKPRVLHHPSNEEERHAWLSLLVRAQGGFSRDLLRHAQTNSSTLVRLDGPYGSTHPLALLRSVDCAIIVAGGSGVAVAFPLLWTLLNPAAKPDLERQTRGIAAGTGVAGGNYRPRKVCFLWVVRKASHREWLPEQRLEELRQWGADFPLMSSRAPEWFVEPT